ncbi:MAG: radical SAM family heme chaperone HemW [Rickettsiales bacterium]|nr:radical SAM family heme chaperone HemW [Rickettsiales bacterium]
MQNLSIYIHYPFCKSKCPYCDFNSYCNIKIDEEKLLQAYLNEIEFYKETIKDRNINTIYFGGGTPSLMGENLLSKIFEKINKIGKINKNCEISLEANPNSITYDKLKNFKNIGINRLSIGVQSLYDEDLKKLGRIHNRQNALDAIKSAQEIFGNRYSVDLIYARPNQTKEAWKNELEEAIKLSPFHISLYQLIIEKGTLFYKNKIQVPNDDVGIDLYNTTNEILEKNNIKFYEISNYAKNGYECKHNLVYWQNGNWLGIGAGAHSRLDLNGKRYAIENIRDPEKWVDSCLIKSCGKSKKYYLSTKEIIEEFILMGLRIKDGIDITNLQKNIKCESFYDILDKKNVDFLVKNHFIKANDNKIKINKNSFILLNSIIEKVLLF